MSVYVELMFDRGRLQQRLRRPGGPLEQHLRRRTEQVADRARRLAPGSMAQRITDAVVSGPNGLAGEVTCHHPAILHVLFGTRPHLIRPRRRRALRFVDGGRVVFAKLVRHPGTQPNPFLQEALRQVMGR